MRIGLQRDPLRVAARAGLILHSESTAEPVCIVNPGVYTEYDYGTEDMSAAELGVVVGLNSKRTPLGLTLEAGTVPKHSWYAGVGPSLEWRLLRFEALVRLHRIRYDVVTLEWRTGTGSREIGRQAEIEMAAGLSAKVTAMMGPHRR